MPTKESIVFSQKSENYKYDSSVNGQNNFYYYITRISSSTEKNLIAFNSER